MAFFWTTRQREVLGFGRLPNPNVLVQGAPNTSKTTVTLASFLLWSLSYENQLFGICAKNFDLVELVPMRVVRDFCKAYDLPYKATIPNMPRTFGIGSNLYQKVSANNIARKEAVQGGSFAGLYIDEVVNIPREVFEELETRVRGVPSAKLWMTRNMVGMQHWFKRAYVDRADELEMIVYQLRFADNPTIDETFIARMRSRQGGLHRRSFLGVDADLTGLIYPNFYNPAEAPLREGAAAWYVSVDPSESGTTHALLFGLFDGAWWAVDELVINTAEMTSVTHRDQARDGAAMGKRVGRVPRWRSSATMPARTSWKSCAGSTRISRCGRR